MTRPVHDRFDRSRGFTVAEILVALAVAAAIMLVLSRALGASRVVRDLVDRRATATARATAVPRLLEDALGRAGRGLETCGVLFGSPDRWRTLAMDLGDAGVTTVEVFADRDGGGRPALYRRKLPWVRQPWLEDVSAFGVLEGQSTAGEWRALVGDGTTRWRAVRVELAWSDGDVRTYDVRLPHAPCAVPP